MCGIAGVVGVGGEYGSLRRRLVEQATLAQRRRGPDGFGIWDDPAATVTLGTARLEVTGGPAAAQPLHDPWAGTTVFNGEIYDHLRIGPAHGLDARRAEADGLALAAVLATAGPSGLRRVPGMFAAARWDPRTRSLTLVRDAVGQKPLYLTRLRDGWCFASTVRAIALMVGPLKLRAGAVEEYLTLKSVGGLHSAFQGIEQIAPGSAVTLAADGSRSDTRWWTPPPVDTVTAPDPAEIRQLVDAAVERRSRAAGTTSVFVSGGLDSAIVLASAKQYATRLHPIAVGYDEDDGHDERKFARGVAQHVGLELEEIVVEPEMVPALLRDAVRATEDPIQDPIVVPTLALAERASEHGKVVLTGDGSDEVWGGYERFADVPRGRRRYLDRAAVFRPDELGLDDYPSGYFDDLADADPDSTDPLDRIQRFEVENRLRNYHLARLDKVTMHHGLEARSPFLDISVVERGLRIAGAAKRVPLPKQPLIDAFGDRLPGWLPERPKQPFSMPIARWMSGPLYDELVQRLDRGSFCTAWVDPDPVLEALRSPGGTDLATAAKAWSLLCLETWHESVAVPLTRGEPT